MMEGEREEGTARPCTHSSPPICSSRRTKGERVAHMFKSCVCGGLLLLCMCVDVRSGMHEGTCSGTDTRTLVYDGSQATSRKKKKRGGWVEGGDDVRRTSVEGRPQTHDAHTQIRAHLATHPASSIAGQKRQRKPSTRAPFSRSCLAVATEIECQGQAGRQGLLALS